MNKSLKYILGVLGILAALVAVVLGSFEPFLKAQSYIRAISSLGSVKSLQAFEDDFDAAFNFPSPVGAEELAKFSSQQVISIVSQDSTPENVSRAVVNYIEPHLLPFGNDVVQLLTLTQLRAILWRRFHQTADYYRAEKYLLKALSIGPKLPPVLYGLADLYASSGDAAKFRTVAETILTYWPEDTQMRNSLESVSGSAKATPK